jgi:hypothetical protein
MLVDLGFRICGMLHKNLLLDSGEKTFICFINYLIFCYCRSNNVDRFLCEAITNYNLFTDFVI